MQRVLLFVYMINELTTCPSYDRLPNIIHAILHDLI